MEVSEGFGAVDAKVFGNVLNWVGSSGDILNRGVLGATFENNIVDGYAEDGTNAIGVASFNEQDTISSGNLVRCGNDAGGCYFGVVAGGGAGMVSWEDANVVLGIDDGGDPLFSNLTAGDEGVNGSGCGDHAVDVWAGQVGVDLFNGVDGVPYDCTNHPYNPNAGLPSGPQTLSIAGWPAWRISSDSAVDGGAQISTLTGGSLGETVHLYFAGLNPVTVLTSGGIDLAAPFVAAPNGSGTVDSSLTLLSVATSGATQWVEVARTNGL
jgi:hypothetical protein